MRDYTGIAYATIPPSEAPTFIPRLRDMLGRIDFYLRDSSRGFSRISLGQVPDSSGTPIGSGGTLTDYLYLPGRSGGQVAHGDIGPGGTLTLKSTSSSSLGKILFGSSAAFDEANVRLGLGTISPAAVLHLQQASGAITIRPNSTIAAGGGQGQDGGTTNLHNYINDQSNSTYVTWGGAVASFELSDATDPGIDTGHVVNYNYRNTSSSATGRNLQVELYQGAGTLIRSGTLHTDIPLGASWIAGSFTLTEAQAASITNYADLRLIITTGGAGGTEGPSLSEASLDLPGITSADLMRWDATGGSTQTGKISSEGYLGVGSGSSTLTAMLASHSGSGGQVASIFRAASGQVANITEWQSSTPAVLSRITSNGTFDGPIAGSLTSINVADNVLTIFDNTTTTKILALELDGLAVGTHTYRPPPTAAASTSTLAAIDLAQTFTKAQSFDPDSDAVPITIIGQAGQTVDLLKIQTSAGAHLLRVYGASPNTGFIVIGGEGPTGGLNPSTLVVRRDDASPLTNLGLWNGNTADTSGAILSFRGNTTGVGASEYQELAAIVSDFFVHDHPTRSSRLRFLTATGAGAAPTTKMWLESTGRLSLGSPAVAPTARLDIVNPTAADVVIRLAGAASQSANLLLIEDSAAADLITVASGGATVIAPTSGTPLTLSPPSGTELALTTAHTDTAFVSTGDTGGIWKLAPTLSNASTIDGTMNIVLIAPTISNIIDTTSPGFLSGLYVNPTLSLDPANANTSDTYGLRFNVITTGNAGGPVWANVVGVQGRVTQSAAADGITTATGCLMTLNLLGDPITNARGYNLATTFGSITATNVVGYTMGVPASGTITTWKAFNAPAFTAGPTVTTAIGLDMGNISVASTNRSLRIGTSAAAAPSVHWGLFRFGDGTAPLHRIDIAAGTATVAPIRLAAATLMTSPVAGCKEYDGSFFYQTPASATRQAVATDRNVVTAGGDVLTYDGEVLLAA